MHVDVLVLTCVCVCCHRQEMIPRDSAASRLSNTVIAMEEDAINKIRNCVDIQVRRNVRNVHLYYNLQAMLDLSRYGDDINVLCRSLRRCDHTYTCFAGLVGCLLLESQFTKGTHAVAYMQLRMQRERVQSALNQAVSVLLHLTKVVPVDKLGAPAHGTLFEYKGKPIIFVTGEDAKIAVVRAGKRGLNRGMSPPPAVVAVPVGGVVGGGPQPAAGHAAPAPGMLAMMGGVPRGGP